MRKILIILLVLVTGYCIQIQDLSVAEDVGFVKGLWRKMLNRARPEEEKTEAPKKIPIEKPRPEQVPRKELSKEEIIEVLNNNLSIYDDFYISS